MGRRKKRKVQFSLHVALIFPIFFCSDNPGLQLPYHDLDNSGSAPRTSQIMDKICTEKNTPGRRRNQKPAFLFPVSTAGLWSHDSSLVQESLNSSGTASEVHQRERQVPELSGSQMIFLETHELLKVGSLLGLMV